MAYTIMKLTFSHIIMLVKFPMIGLKYANLFALFTLPIQLPSRNKIISNLLSAFLLQISSLHFSKALHNNNAYTEQLIKLRQAIYNALEKNGILQKLLTLSL